MMATIGTLGALARRLNLAWFFGTVPLSSRGRDAAPRGRAIKTAAGQSWRKRPDAQSTRGAIPGTPESVAARRLAWMLEQMPRSYRRYWLDPRGRGLVAHAQLVDWQSRTEEVPSLQQLKAWTAQALGGPPDLRGQQRDEAR